MKDKALFYGSLMVAGYFAVLFMNAYWLRINSPVFSFLQESLTIPVLLLQGILLAITAYKIGIRKVHSRQALIALFFLIVTSIATYGSLLGIIKIK